MPQPITVTHVHGDHISVRLGRCELFRYVYRPDPPPFEAPKPYPHPVRTLAGAMVTGYRPHDHRWHKGIQMTACHVSGQNFWGGDSYRRRPGVPRCPTVGSMRHDGFAEFTEAAGSRFAERLTGGTTGGQEWVDEVRGSPSTPSSGRRLGAGLGDPRSPTCAATQPCSSAARPPPGRRAGYTGLFWRGPRAFTGGACITPAAAGQARGPETDGPAGPPGSPTPPSTTRDAHSTLLFSHAPENADATCTRPLVRAQHALPGGHPLLGFAEEFALPPGETFRLPLPGRRRRRGVGP